MGAEAVCRNRDGLRRAALKSAWAGRPCHASEPLLQWGAMSQVNTAEVSAFPCPRCGNWLNNGALVCPNCGGLVYAQQLNELAAEAQRREPTDPIGAAQLWQQALGLVPPDSQQFQAVRERMGMLMSRMGMPVVSQMTAAAQPVV